MGVNSLPKTVTRQRRDCDLNPGPSAPEFSALTTRLPSHPYVNWAPKSAHSPGVGFEPHLIHGSLGPAIHIPNDISIGSSVLVQLADVTDRPTTLHNGNNRPHRLLRCGLKY